MAMQFAQILADDKGYISTSHMKWFMEAEGSRNYEDEATMNELLRTLDTNGDGKIDREELAAFIEQKSQRLSVDKDFVVAMDRLNQFALRMRQRERLAQDLATVLADSNGVISSDHMHWFFQAEGSREYDDEKKLQALMLKLDTNGDGVVDRDELVVFILRKAHDANDSEYAEGIGHLKQFAQTSWKRTRRKWWKSSQSLLSRRSCLDLSASRGRPFQKWRR